MDAELLEAFLPEWAAACARLAAAPGDARALANLRALAEAPGAEVLAPHIGVLPPEDLAAQAETLLRPTKEAPEAVSGAALGTTTLEAQLAAGVLIIDDSPTMRRILREIIAEDAAFAILGEAGDGEAGLAAMARLQPSLTLLDIEMPVMDGIGVLRRWALRGPGQVLVVSSSAQSGGDVALEAMRLGATAVVAKPSGALSLDMAQQRGADLLRAARSALGLPHAA
jgi:CheY-like chemotaxis protein